jgi:hypothetical protein
VPLVRRALKVLVDREVSPQLGLLKSTLLQLDSTFSERTYGAGSFRDFAQKLASAGHVTLRESGRNVLVELADGNGAGPAEERAPRQPHSRGPREEAQPQPQPQQAESAAPAETPLGPVRMADAIREVRRIFQAAPNPPRFPMYLRQAKQFMRNIDPTFDERQYGFANLGDLVRACQREGVFRIERDRQGGIRLFAGNVMQPAVSVDADDDNRGNVAEPIETSEPREPEWAPKSDDTDTGDVVDGDVVQEMDAGQPVMEGETSPAEDEPAPAKKPARGRTARGRTAKTAGEAKPAAEGRTRKTADGSAKTRKTATAKPRAPRARKTP